MQDDDPMKQQLAVLGARYLSRTLHDLQRIDELIVQFDAGSPTALKELERAAHKVHGSGAMFGFGDLSAQSGEVEHFAARLAAIESARVLSQEPNKDALRQQLVAAVAKLRKIANDTARAAGITRNDG